MKFLPSVYFNCANGGIAVICFFGANLLCVTLQVWLPT